MTANGRRWPLSSNPNQTPNPNRTPRNHRTPVIPAKAGIQKHETRPKTPGSLQRRQGWRIRTSWTPSSPGGHAGRDAFTLAERLQAAGVPAGPVLRGPDLLEDKHYDERGTFVTVDHPQVGPKQYPGLPWKMSRTPGEVRWPSPTLGQHNREVFGGLLGLTSTEIDALESNGVIGTKPTGSRII